MVVFYAKRRRFALQNFVRVFPSALPRKCKYRIHQNVLKKSTVTEKLRLNVASKIIVKCAHNLIHIKMRKKIKIAQNYHDNIFHKFPIFSFVPHRSGERVLSENYGRISEKMVEVVHVASQNQNTPRESVIFFLVSSIFSFLVPIQSLCKMHSYKNEVECFMKNKFSIENILRIRLKMPWPLLISSRIPDTEFCNHVFLNEKSHDVVFLGLWYILVQFSDFYLECEIRETIQQHMNATRTYMSTARNPKTPHHFTTPSSFTSQVSNTDTFSEGGSDSPLSMEYRMKNINFFNTLFITQNHLQTKIIESWIAILQFANYYLDCRIKASLRHIVVEINSKRREHLPKYNIIKGFIFGLEKERCLGKYSQSHISFYGTNKSATRSRPKVLVLKKHDIFCHKSYKYKQNKKTFKNVERVYKMKRKVFQGGIVQRMEYNVDKLEGDSKKKKVFQGDIVRRMEYKVDKVEGDSKKKKVFQGDIVQRMEYNFDKVEGDSKKKKIQILGRVVLEIFDV